jgi:hypothetical protein
MRRYAGGTMKHGMLVFMSLPTYVRFLWFFAAFEAISLALRTLTS